MTIAEKTISTIEAGTGESVWIGGDFITFKVSSEMTGGAYSMAELTSLPDSQVLPHIHYEHDEAYYILEGEYEFTDLTNNRTFQAPAGTFLNIVRGIAHVYKNVSATSNARMLVIATPGEWEGFLHEAGIPGNDVANPPVVDGPPDLEALTALAAKYKSAPVLPA